MTNPRTISSLAAIAVATLSPTAASAQASSAVTAGPAATANQDLVPGEIIVTAQRRSENALKQPLAVSVISARDLAANAVNQVEDLQRVAPSLTVSDNGVTKYINIRGIGLGVSAPGVANGVAYFVDGLFLPSAPLYQNDPYFDLARVEVLRGPQGTLVGQSSTGGAVYVVSQAPKLGVTEGYVEQTIGNYRDLRTRGAVNLPIGQNWALRLAGQFEDRRSFFRFIPGPGRPPQKRVPGDLNRFSGRASLYGKMGALDVTIRSEFDRKRSGGTTGKPIPGDPVDPVAIAASPTRPFTLSYDAPTRDNVKTSENSITLNLPLSDTVAVRSLSGITTGKRDFLLDVDGSPAPNRSRTSHIAETNYSEELTFLSTGTSAFQWVTGVFDVYQALHGTNTFYNPPDLPPPGPPPPDAPPGPPPPPGPAITIAHGKQGNNSFGVYGQGTLTLSPTLQIVGGLRYSIDHTHSFDSSYVITHDRPRSNPGEQTSRALTGKVAVNFNVTRDQFLYATVSRGYKAGGFNDITSKFDPEKVWNYEAGLKSSFAGGTIRTQINGYYEKYTDIQVEVYSGFLAFNNVGNGARATVYGAEGQLQALFGDFHVDASGAYNHSRVQSGPLVNPRLLPGGGAVALCDFFTDTPQTCDAKLASAAVTLTGRSLPYAPRWTGHLGAEYQLQFGAGTLTPRITLSYLSKQFANLFADPVDLIPARTLVDLDVRYEARRGITVDAYATNVTNKTYISGKFDNLQYYGSPRQYGVRVGVKF